MNITDLISELYHHQLIEGQIPNQHHVYHRESEYHNSIEQSKPKSILSDDNDRKDISIGTLDGDEYIYISNGDIQVLPDVDFEELDAKVKSGGIDALAWYRSFHWNPADRWGIYILDKGIYYLVKHIFEKIIQVSKYGRPYNTLDFLQQGYKLLFLHEYFHFITDIAASTLEASACFHKSYYTEYLKNVYMKSQTQDEPIEEALANAFAYNKFREKGVCPHLHKFMKSQPNGYSAFDQYIRKKNFTNGRRTLGTCIRDSAIVHGISPLENLFDCYMHDLNFGDVPVYIVQTVKQPDHVIKFIQSIPRSSVITSSSFDNDLNQLPKEIKAKFEKAMYLLEYRIHHSGLGFEKIKGCDTVFTIRIDRKYRLSLKPYNGKWELLRIAEHDEVYRNPGKK